MTVREMKSFLMEAAQDLTVRHRVVYDVQGREVARLCCPRECCGTCRTCRRIEMWSVVRHVCGDPSLCTSVDVEPDGWCPYYEPEDFGLTMDIWY